MSANARSLRYLLGWLIAGTRGGITRAKIIKTIHDTPQNANQMATALKVDYKTVRYHLEVLEKNRIVTSVGDKYGATYFLSQVMEDNYVVFEEILKKIWKNSILICLANARIFLSKIFEMYNEFILIGG